MANYTILLIDYEPRSIKRTRTALEDAGFTVEVANDGIQGLKTFEKLEPDMVLIEAMIPKKHGFEVCQEIKKGPRGKQVIVAIMTAVYRGRKYRTQALHLHGCDEYIEKPIDDEKLVDLCRSLLKIEEQEQETAPEPEVEPPEKAPEAKAKKKAEKPAAPAGPDLADAEDEIAACLDALIPDEEDESGGATAEVETLAPTAAKQIDADL